MRVVDTTPTFFALLKDHEELTVDILENDYYQAHPEVFDLYFPRHCPRTAERLDPAIARYPNDLDSIKSVARQLPSIIEKVMKKFAEYFGTELDLQFNLLVGGYGSNAFVEQKIIGQATFAVEKLSTHPDHLHVIVAHEIAHIYHNYLSDQAGLKWSEVEWGHGTNGLYREGVATYISQKIIPGLSESIYFSYDGTGNDWVQYANEHYTKITASFLQDAQGEWTKEKEKEWFRLSGGSYFGYNRLGYYLGTAFLHHLVLELGEEKALTYWVSERIKEKVEDWLELQGKITVYESRGYKNDDFL